MKAVEEKASRNEDEHFVKGVEEFVEIFPPVIKTIFDSLGSSDSFDLSMIKLIGLVCGNLGNFHEEFFQNCLAYGQKTMDQTLGELTKYSEEVKSNF